MSAPDKCPGSGTKPKRVDGAGLGDCAKCSATVRIKDGKLRSHYRPADAQAIRQNLWSGFNS